MAEKERFELSNGFTRYTISSRAPSTKLGDFSTIGTSSARQQGIVYHNIYDSSRGKTRFFSIAQTAATAASSPDVADISSRHGHHPQSTGGCGGSNSSRSRQHTHRSPLSSASRIPIIASDSAVSPLWPLQCFHNPADTFSTYNHSRHYLKSDSEATVSPADRQNKSRWKSTWPFHRRIAGDVSP